MSLSVCSPAPGRPQLQVYDDGYTTLPSSIVDIWLSYDEVEKAVKSGHRIVSSFGLYLDQQTPFGGTHYFWADTWWEEREREERGARA